MKHWPRGFSASSTTWLLQIKYHYQGVTFPLSLDLASMEVLRWSFATGLWSCRWRLRFCFGSPIRSSHDTRSSAFSTSTTCKLALASGGCGKLWRLCADIVGKSRVKRCVFYLCDVGLLDRYNALYSVFSRKWSADCCEYTLIYST